MPIDIPNTNRVNVPGLGDVHMRVAPVSNAKGDVIYVHGATFPSELSVFFKFDGQSWADALNAAGFNAWGFDFVGYGKSSRYAAGGSTPRGTIDKAVPQLRSVVEFVRKQNGGGKFSLLAHSWGTQVASRFAANHPEGQDALVLFGPPVTRGSSTPAAIHAPTTSHYPLSVWAQYRRFVADVPRDSSQVLSEAHFQTWSEAFLATDDHANTRETPSVLTPTGPAADFVAMRNGQMLFNAAKIETPVLLIRGEWDSLCNDDDANHLMRLLGSRDKTDIKISRATHLMHLEQQRVLLHEAVNAFLVRIEGLKK